MPTHTAHHGLNSQSHTHTPLRCGRFDVIKPGWDGTGPEQPWVDESGASLTGKGGILEGGSFLYCNARDVRDNVVQRPDLGYYMRGGSAAFTNGVCSATTMPCSADGSTSLETLTIAEI
eukprot:m.76959 g.76959  ORF g.76959 m.76959 type:complete len:119 (+) comp10569_c0_seq2:1505-1861(+)